MDEADVRWVLSRNHERQLCVAELQQGPGIVLIANFAAKMFAIPVHRLAHILNGDGHVVDRIQGARRIGRWQRADGISGFQWRAPLVERHAGHARAIILVTPVHCIGNALEV